MFFHGIDYHYLARQYPVLSSRYSEGKTEEQAADRRHLLKKFGIEPVHLLEYNRREFTLNDCLKSCFNFGNVVFAFRRLPLPFWQLSTNEVGVAALRMDSARWIFIKDDTLLRDLKSKFPIIPIITVKG
ncbi:hypothetical protein PP175_20565 [Aneurinibacillus sp. Ricciae_BoGa-3]|uniref:hypothetical protein n=1 Tax=Aneurinibacillus sp. Ricciae_BoGa-3 TaxID=3022697 RepID=UPI002341E1A1|nr:hypothetical protein [Aneurinibacillus sp. Ricciae_BoGa-3]WCK53699.1 hypothetical protein PP175_20565 [Aneurinibacillus sp. Ricciae_BoGa-3]